VVLAVIVDHELNTVNIETGVSVVKVAGKQLVLMGLRITSPAARAELDRVLAADID
jgi:hypothetical protein